MLNEDTKHSLNNLQPIRTSNQRIIDARNQPKINQLCSMIWHTNELHVLFSDTGYGKSIFAVQMSDGISKGYKFLNLENENEPLTVLYYDFELSDRQFSKRYSNEFGVEYSFSPLFYIDNIDFAALSNIDPNAKFEDLLFEKIIYDVKTLDAKVLVIDNLTFLNTQSTQDTQIAMTVMRKLNEIKKDFNLSILVVAHTPKRSHYTPFTNLDLAGSKHLSNFSDSISAIGKSCKNPNYRYWKQVKCRNGEMIFDSDNVILCELKKDDTFLSFHFIEYANEYDHLKQEAFNSTPDKLDDVVELINQGLTYDQIAKQLDISKGTITKWRKKYPERFVSVSNVS